MYELWYVSSHGFGHITRVVANIEKKLKADANYRAIIVCGKNQIEFAQEYFLFYYSRLIFHTAETDIGLINRPLSLEVDKEALEISLLKFIDSWNLSISTELSFLKNYEIENIFTDISPIGILVAEKLGKPINLISNFTWYQQYKFLNLNSFILEKYLELDRKIDNLYLYPLHLNFSHITPKKVIEMEFICREINCNRVSEIKKQYGKSIFISCGKSAELGKIKILNFDGTVFVTSGLEVENPQGVVINLPVDTLDTHNYLAASELIISKAGWGTVAEGVCADVPMVLLERDGVLEDTHIIREMKKIKPVISKKLQELREIDFLEISVAHDC